MIKEIIQISKIQNIPNPIWILVGSEKKFETHLIKISE